MSQMLKSSGAIAAATLTSRFLGLGREVAYAAFMGTHWVAGSFMFAFMIPNLFRRLLGEGALTAAFIPLFKEREKQAGERQMWQMANAVLSGLVVAAFVLVVVGVLGVTIALRVREFPDQTSLMLHLLRWMFPYVLLVCVAAIFMAMLNARGHFFVPALGPIVLNLVLIGAVLWGAPLLGGSLSRQVFALAIGVLVAGVLQAAFQIPLLLREGFRFRWVTPWRSDAVRQVVSKMIPGAVGVAAFQINVLLTNGIAFWVDPEVIASFNYAVRLMELPQGVFGLSLATYLLPTLSGLAADKKYPEFRGTLREGVGYITLVNLLASVLLIVLAAPTVRLLFERGAFDIASTERTVSALVWLAPGLAAFSMVNILARAFYALGDVRTPMRISVFCLGLNVILVFALVWRYRQAGLGAANSLCALINVTLLSYALRRKLAFLEWASLGRSVLVMALTALVSGGIAWVSHMLWEDRYGHGTFGLKLGAALVPMTLATVTYVGICVLLKVESLEQVSHFVASRLRKRGFPRA